MSPFQSLLVPLDGSRAAASGLGCAAWLASRLDARLHVLNATTTPLPAMEELVRLRVPEAYWPQVILHQAPRFPEDAILAAVEEYKANLVVMSARGEAGEKTSPRTPDVLKSIGHVTRTVIEQSTVPVLLLPTSYREDLRWKQVLTECLWENAV